MLGTWEGCHGKSIRMIKSFTDDKIFCGLEMRNNIGHNKVNVEKRCSNH
ncbi:unnamed protein product [Brassica oleracea]